MTRDWCLSCLLMRDDDTVNDTVNDTVKSDMSALSKTEQKVLAAIGSFPDYSYEKLAEFCHLSRPTIDDEGQVPVI